MNVYIRDLKTWDAISHYTTNDWSLVLFDSEDSNGRISIPVEDANLAGNWIIVEDILYYISSASIGEGVTELTICEPYYAFNRTLVYHGNGKETLETFIVSTIQNEFINQQDTFYSFPYVTVSSTSETSVKIDIKRNEEFSFIDILQLSKEKGIIFEYEYSRNGVSIVIGTKSHITSQVFFNDGHTLLEESALSDELVAKVTVRRTESNNDIITVLETRDYYWHKDGTIDRTPPDPRLPGKWEITSFTLNEGESLNTVFQEKANEAMDKNDDTYKITFYSDRVYKNGDKISCVIGGVVYLATITCCQVSSNNSLYYYRAGNLPTKLTEKLIDSVKKKR